MAPRPYSERSALPIETAENDLVLAMPAQNFTENSSQDTLNGTATLSSIPLGLAVAENLIVATDIQENFESPDEISVLPCYPTPEDIMPYDHSLPDFIRQISNQSNLSNIQILSLRVISSLISLHRMSEYLPNLKELNLEGSALNSLRDIGCNFKNLQILKIGRCQLESLDGTFGLSSLKELYAQKNLINDVSPCSNLPHIQHIDVSYNRIRNISYAGFLSACTELRSINFTGNPATEVLDYRKHVRRILPQINVLDGIPFTSEECKEEGDKKETDEILSESSNNGSEEVLNFFPVSSSDSMSNFLDPEEMFEEGKKIRNVHEKSSDFQLKFLSLQKLDKDIENKSKKSNVDKSHCHLEKKKDNSWIFSSSNLNLGLKGEVIPEKEKVFWNSNEEWKGKQEETDSEKSKASAQSFSTSCSSSFVPEENKFGANLKINNIERFVQTFNSKTENELNCKSDSALCKLTTGIPVCGNLTAALRNRKKMNGDSEWNNERK